MFSPCFLPSLPACGFPSLRRLKSSFIFSLLHSGSLQQSNNSLQPASPLCWTFPSDLKLLTGFTRPDRVQPISRQITGPFLAWSNRGFNQLLCTIYSNVQFFLQQIIFSFSVCMKAHMNYHMLTANVRPLSLLHHYWAAGRQHNLIIKGRTRVQDSWVLFLLDTAND